MFKYPQKNISVKRFAAFVRQSPQIKRESLAHPTGGPPDEHLTPLKKNNKAK